jgi:hypothetical protein
MDNQHPAGKAVKWTMIAMVVAGALLASSLLTGTARAMTTHFLLRADAAWADSGVNAVAGHRMTITAYGDVVTARINIFGPASHSSPNGQVYICPNFDGAPPCAMDGAPYGALVGKVGAEGVPFLIGSDFTFTPVTSGDLYLAVNDLLPYYDDNYGNYMVFFK